MIFEIYKGIKITIMRYNLFIAIVALCLFSCDFAPHPVQRHYIKKSEVDPVDSALDKEIFGYYSTAEGVKLTIEKNQKSIEQDKKSYFRWITQARAYCTLKDYKTSLSLLDSAKHYAVDDTERLNVDLYRGYILEDSGDVNGAHKYYNNALREVNKNQLRQILVIMQRWECLLAAKGLDTATAYLKKSLPQMNLPEDLKKMYNGLVDRSAVKVMGRKWYIHDKASGMNLATDSELADMRIIYSFYTSYFEEAKKTVPNMDNILKSAVTKDLFETIKRDNNIVMGIPMDSLKSQNNLEISKGVVTKTDNDSWYKVNYQPQHNNFKVNVKVHMTGIDNKRVIDKII